MSQQFYPSGAGESLGDSMVTSGPMVTTGYIWYVYSGTGVDAAGDRGKDRTRPLATIGQAYTNASAGDIIVLMDGHTETRTSALTIAKSLKIVGAGSSGGLPTAKLTINSAASELFIISANSVQLRNIWFEENSQANASDKIRVTGAGFRMKGCYLECGDTDDGPALNLSTGANYANITSTTFVSTATALTTQPPQALYIGAAHTGLTMDGVVFDGGTKGYSGFHAINDTYGVTLVLFEGISLLRGADVKMDADATGTIISPTSASSALIEWTGSGGV